MSRPTWRPPKSSFFSNRDLERLRRMDPVANGPGMRELFSITGVEQLGRRPGWASGWLHALRRSPETIERQSS